MRSVKFQISSPNQQFFDGLGTAGETSDSWGTTVQCPCEVVQSDGVIRQSKNDLKLI